MDRNDSSEKDVDKIDDGRGCNATGTTGHASDSDFVTEAVSNVAGSAEKPGKAPSRQKVSNNGHFDVKPGRQNDKAQSESWKARKTQNRFQVHLASPEALRKFSEALTRPPQRASSTGNPGIHSPSAMPEKRKCPPDQPSTKLPNDLMEKIVQTVEPAWKKQLRNDGSTQEALGIPANGTSHGRKKAPGVDKKSILQAYREHQADPEKMARELLTGYNPSPIRQVAIPKESGGTRLLEIPVARDRTAQTAMLMVIGPPLDKGFSDSSHGFRFGRSVFTAARQVLAFLKEGAEFAVKIDFCKCFDEIDHNIMMRIIREICPDIRVCQLIERFLKSEVVLSDGTRVKSGMGVHQGSPLGPLLMNMYLDILDRELTRRNLRHTRYADDLLVMVDSKKAAKRVLKSIGDFVSKELNLRVNLEKSKTMHVREIEFLGFAFSKGIMIGAENLENFKSSIKWMTRGQTQKDAEGNLERFKLWLVRWLSHFGRTDDREQVTAIHAWVIELMRQRERDGYLLIDAFRRTWDQSVRRHGTWKQALAMHEQSIRQK